jgi:glycosyltransferase involved in cell wall biosynthesis
MKNILFFAPYLKPVSNAAALRCHALLESMGDKGFKVKTVSYAGESDATLLVKNQDSKAKFLKRLVVETFSGLEVSLRVCFSRQELIIFSFPPFLPALFGATVCAFLRRKYILDVRDIYPEPYFVKNLTSENSIPARLIKKWAALIYRNAHHIIVVTVGFAEIMKKYGISESKITLIRNGYTPELFSPNSEKFQKFTAVFHGHLSHFRELDIIPKLAEKNKDVEFIVVGDGAQGDFFRKQKISNLKYMGHLEHMDLVRLVSRCHVGLSFRTNDIIGKTSIPIKIYEYIGMGIPSIVTPRGEAGALVEEMRVGYQFENDELEQMSACLALLKTDSEVLKDLCDNILKVRKNFDRKIISQELPIVLSKI